ncbi:MAG: UDP-2,3-diacylglucosamine diphosphatase [Gammaproteobacteria bacterium]|nr:UDP-2,3-diacylglucosamine diphosphatase [Gammaproteobacteria bacterium]
MAQQWFISDLHLALNRPATLALFERFLAHLPQPGDRLFILGDLFDAWIGDDDDDELAQRVPAALAQTSARGVQIAIQRGNRDFLMGRRLMQACGASLLDDCHVTTVAGTRTLLMHGDLLCTDDVDYQRARRRWRNPLVRWYLLRKPLSERRQIAAGLRKRSGEAKSMKAADIMDVNDDTVIRYLKRYRVRQLIHGHTHRPAVHLVDLPGNGQATRVVLPEWHETGTHAWVDDGRRLNQLTID